MTTPAPVSAITVPPLGEDDLDVLQVAYRRRRLARFSSETLLWLAAVPEWPMPLAQECRFPTGNAASLADLVQQLVGAGLAEQRESIEESGELITAFWLSPSRRPEVGGYLRQTLTSADLSVVIREISGALDAVADSTQRWAQIEPWQHMYQVGQDPSGARLNRAVDGLIRDGRTQHALQLVAAAQAVGDVVGEPLVSAARRATWRLDRAYRQAMDVRMLADYLPRQELEDVLEQLVDGRLPVLHLLGQGGVGKTMVVRSLASGEFARRHGRAEFPVARIDFDYLDPRYPETRPVELLLALAAELAGYSSSRTQLTSLRRFEDAAAALHESLAGSGSGSGTRSGTASAPGGGSVIDSRAGTDTDPVLAHTIDAFIDYLGELDGPVVLVLDTCEELAKLHAPGAPAPALERTFHIIERLRDGVEHVRVLLAGRRPLVPPAGDPRLSSDVDLCPRDYVTVVQVGGFTPAEALEYIERRDERQLVSPELRAAVLDRCLHEDRVNPFDLAGYLDWAIDEPDLDPQTLRSAPGDPYVEQRILGRITAMAVRDALPVAVQLGRFDQQMIAPAMARRGVDPNLAFSGLAGQEWVTAVSFLPDGRPRVIGIDEHLRARLRAVIDADAALAVDRHALGADLRRLVAEQPVTNLPIEIVEAALRLLTPQQAGDMWMDFEATVAAGGDWGWAVQVLPRVAAVEAELAESRTPTVMAAILATQAAAVMRLPGRPGVRALWDDVTALAPRHPDPDQRRQLQFRAACGRLACAGSSARAPLDADPELHRDVDVMLGWADGVHELPWSAVAAVDGLTAGGFALPNHLRDVTDVLCGHVDPRVASTALLARATGHLAVPDLRAALSDVDAALDRLGSAASADDGPHPIDWMPPRRLLDRARLARACCARLAGERPQRRFDLWRREAMRHLDDIDAERLVAVSIAHEADWRAPDPHFVTAAAARESYVPSRRPTHHWHQRVTPLRPTLAGVLGEMVAVDAAVLSLHERRKVAVAAGDDPDTVAACDAVLIELCRRYRTTELSESVHRLARDGAPELRAEALAVLALVKGESAADPEHAGSWHLWWRTQVIAGSRLGGLARHPRYAALGAVPVPDLATQVDQLELDWLFGPSPGWSEPQRRDEITYAMRWMVFRGELLTADSSSGLGVALRADALLGIPEVADALDALPPRLVARAALSEGELLALRLPHPACALLRLAQRKFTEAGDDVGAERAHILLVLTAARADAGEVEAMPEPPAPRFSSARLGDAWVLRREVADALRTGTPLPGIADASPELQLVLARRSEPFASARAQSPVRVPASEAESEAAYALQAPVEVDPVRSSPVEKEASFTPPRSRRRVVVPALVALVALVTIIAAVLIRIGGPDDAAGVPPTPTAPAPTLGTTGPPTPGETMPPGPTGSPPTPTRSPTASPEDVDNFYPESGLAIVAATVVAIVAAVLVAIGWPLVRARRRRRSPPAETARHDELSLYEQQTVAAYVGPHGGTWWTCRLSVTSTELRISPDRGLALGDVEGTLLANTPAAGGVTTHARSRRPYVVIPLIELGPRAAGDRDQRVAVTTGQLSSQPELLLQVDGLQPEAGSTAIPMARVVWRRLDPAARPRYRGPSHVLPASRKLAPWQPDAPCSLLHLVGEPVPTASAGWRLRVSGAVSEQAEYSQHRSKLQGEELLGPDDIRSNKPALVVLQADPVDGPIPLPLGRLRDGMRGLALGLHDVGVDWVIVVPPLPDGLCRDVVGRTMSMFESAEPPHPGLILDLAYDLRVTVGPSHPGPDAEHRAAADDVLLLCRAARLPGWGRDL